jgi:two-component system nitrate/nitrite response regulator NarL
MKESSSVSRIRIMLFSDEPALALGATCLLSSTKDFEVIGGHISLVDLLPAVKRECPGMLLIDLSPEVTFALLSLLHDAVPECRIVLWTRSVGDEIAQQAKDLGIAGMVRRTTSNGEFAGQLLKIAMGEAGFDAPAPERSTKVQLTRRESQIVTLLAQGLKNKEIATCLGITEGTVKSYLVSLFQKVGARDRFELTVLGLKNSYCGQASWDGHGGFVTEPEEGRARPFLKSLILVEPKRRAGYPENSKDALKTAVGA